STYSQPVGFGSSGYGSTSRNAILQVNPLPALQVSPSTDMSSSGNQGGPFSPSSFSYTLNSSAGSVNYTIVNYPDWVTPSSTSGTVDTSGKVVTFTVNANANGKLPGTYGPQVVVFNDA